LSRDWQKINATWQVCHWWHDINETRITAMTYLLIAAATAFAAWLAVHVVAVIRSDGFGYRPPPRSQYDEEMPRHHALWSASHRLAGH